MSHSWYVVAHTLIPTPTNNCEGCSNVFMRPQQLESHIEDVHREELGDYVSSDAIAPLATPIVPTSPKIPPPLPRTQVPCHTLMAYVVPAKQHSFQASLNGTDALSRRWSRLTVQDEVEEEETTIPFGDLFHIDCVTAEAFHPDVKKKPRAVGTQLAHPQPIIHPPMQADDVPQSILYPTFARRVDRLVVDGVLRM